MATIASIATAPELTTHYIVAVPCDRSTGRVPHQALVSALSWWSTRLTTARHHLHRQREEAKEADEADDEEEDEDEDDLVECGGTDWQAIGHDGGERCLGELQAAVRAAAAHQRGAADAAVAVAATETTTPCRLVLAYLDCAPASEAEVAFLRRLGDRFNDGGVVVHVFSGGGRCDSRLTGLAHVALHHEEGQLPARLVWSSARRRPPASLRPALALAQFQQFCRSDYRLALSDDFDQLAARAAEGVVGSPPGLLEPDLLPWQLLDYLDSCQPQLPTLAGWRQTVGGASAELLAAATAARDRALRLARGEETPFAAERRLAAVAASQAALARLLTSPPASLVSVPLAGACAGRFAGALLAAGLRPADFGQSARPELERAMVLRGARFVAGLTAATGHGDEGDGDGEGNCGCRWRVECRRLDEADDCRTAALGFARLAGSRARPDDGDAWAAGVTLTSAEVARLRLRLRLPDDFGEPAAAAAAAAAADEEAAAAEAEAEAAAEAADADAAAAAEAELEAAKADADLLNADAVRED